MQNHTELFKSSAGIYKKRHQKLLFLLRQKIPFATEVLMPILTSQAPFAVLLSVCLSLLPGLSPGHPWCHPKQELDHNQVLMSDVLSTHRRQGTPCVLNHRWNPFHSKRGLPSAATAPLLLLAGVTGKVTQPQGFYISHQPRSHSTTSNLTQRSTTLSRAPKFF